MNRLFASTSPVPSLASIVPFEVMSILAFKIETFLILVMLLSLKFRTTEDTIFQFRHLPHPFLHHVMRVGGG